MGSPELKIQPIKTISAETIAVIEEFIDRLFAGKGPNTRNFKELNKQRAAHTLGKYGEAFVGSFYGLKPNYDIIIGGDCGEDFPVISVKTISYSGLDPILKFNPGEEILPHIKYQLVQELTPGTFRLVGWILGEDALGVLESHNFGNGNMRCVKMKYLTAGLAPLERNHNED